MKHPSYTLVSLLSLLSLAACSTSHASSPALAATRGVPVETAAVAETTWPGVYEAMGTVRARTTTTISSRLMGYAREVRAQSGDHVREGELLAVLDARDLRSNVSRAEAARDELKSAIPESEAALASAGSQLELAQVTFHRMQDLMNKRSITNQEFDESSARLKAAQAGLDVARARRAQLDARLAQTEQDLRVAGIQRDYSEITAPFSGLILTRSIEPGSLAVPGAPLFTIERQGAYRLEASVEESRLSLARVGKAVSVTLDGLDKTVTARVAEIVPAIDPAARTGTVKIDLPPLPQLRSGQFGRVRFEAGSRSALTIPSASVIERGQLQTVYVAENSTAHARLVTVGAAVTGRVEVLSGLHAGEHVISPVPEGVKDGSPIEVRP